MTTATGPQTEYRSWAVEEYRAEVDDANDDYYRYRAPVEGGAEGSPVSDVPLKED